MVISALNTENGQKVAIKKITRAFDDLVDAKRILREITLLRKFSHGNVSSNGLVVPWANAWPHSAAWYTAKYMPSRECRVPSMFIRFAILQNFKLYTNTVCL